MRVLLLNLPWRQKGRLGVRAGSRWPFTSLPEKDGRIHYIPFPFFLAYANSLLKREGKDVKLIDSIAEGIDMDKLLKRISQCHPELIAIETSTPSFKNDLRLAGEIKEELSDCQIAMCGAHASVFKEQILKTHSIIDYVLFGEYEYTLLDLVDALEKKVSLCAVKGLAHKKAGEVVVNMPRATIDDLDKLPWPEREDVPIYNYNDSFAGLPTPNVQMWTSRGCLFKCSFCLWPQALYREHRYRMRTIGDVVDEMEHLIEKYKFKAVFFDDDVINMDREHFLGLCAEIVARKIQIPWAAMARADLMDEALLRAMVDAGIYAVKYGIESADEGILKLCKKTMDFSKAKKMIALTRAMGVKVHLTFCLGLPGETTETLKRTREFIDQVKPDSFQLSLATPFPGTAYFEYMKQHGLLLSEDWVDYDGNHTCVIKTEALGKEELERARDVFCSSIDI